MIKKNRIIGYRSEQTIVQSCSTLPLVIIQSAFVIEMQLLRLTLLQL